MVREHDGPVDAVELGSRIGSHVTTVRFHLDALCDEGAIVRTRMNRASVGRPRTGYRAVEERLDYRVLAEVLAMELGQTAEERARRAQHAGQRWADRITVGSPGEAVVGQDVTDTAEVGDPLDRGAVIATEVFERWVSSPSWRRHQNHRHPCRLIAIRSSRGNGSSGCTPARYGIWPERTPKWRGVHVGLLRGLLAKAEAADDQPNTHPAMSARLEPFVEPELCVARASVSRSTA